MVSIFLSKEFYAVVHMLFLNDTSRKKRWHFLLVCVGPVVVLFDPFD